MPSWWKLIAQQLEATSGSGSWRKRAALGLGALTGSARGAAGRYLHEFLGAEQTVGSWDRRVTPLDVESRGPWAKRLYDSGVLFGGAAAPTGIFVSHESVDVDHVGEFATLLMINGTEPGVFELVADDSGALSIVGNKLHSSGGLSFVESIAYRLKVTDADAREYIDSEDRTITVTMEEEENPAPLPDDGGGVVAPDEPNDPDNNFEVLPIAGNTGDGTKVTGKNGGAATFLYDIGPPQAGAIYTMRYSADWSGMSQSGRRAAVGFAFKQNDSFHLVGYRGNGANPAVLQDSQIRGEFSKANQFTISDQGAVTSATKDGPNWLRIVIDPTGEHYTTYSSADGSTWTEEYSEAVPVPLAAATDAIQFGVGAYFANQDKGVFQIVIEFFTAAFMFIGAELRMSAPKSVNHSTAEAISWDVAADDVGGWFNAGQPTRLTVPAGVSRVRFTAWFDVSGISSTHQAIYVSKNGSGTPSSDGIGAQSGDVEFGTGLMLATAVHEVVAGDYFELYDLVGADVNGYDITTAAYFAVEKVN